MHEISQETTFDNVSPVIIVAGLTAIYCLLGWFFNKPFYKKNEREMSDIDILESMEYQFS